MEVTCKMQCWHPIVVHPSPFTSIEVPCGRCPACRVRRQNDWSFRMLCESMDYSDATFFVTLTYKDECLPLHDGVPVLRKKDLQDFIKRFRKHFDLRYFCCGEYGDKFERPHYHGIFYSHGFSRLDSPHRLDALSSIWHNGIVDCSQPTVSAMKYVAKYTTKSLGLSSRSSVPPFAIMSLKPAIGFNFLSRHDIHDFAKVGSFVGYDCQGTPYSIPRYYKDKIAPLHEYSVRDGELVRNSCYSHAAAVTRAYLTKVMVDSIEERTSMLEMLYPNYQLGLRRKQDLLDYNFKLNIKSYGIY